MKRTIGVALALGMALAPAGCGGDDPAGPGGSEFDAQAVNESMAGVRESLDDDADVLVGLELASQALGAAAGGAAALVGGDLDAPRFSPDISSARAFASAVVAPIFPSNLLGNTFVWNPDGGPGADGAYEIDDALTGAPANGVRFILYAIEPLTRRPVEPLVEVGQLDLIDESGAESVRLVVEAVVGGETLVDYFIDGSYAATAQAATVTALSVGFLSDGTRRLDFGLEQSASFVEGSSTVTLGLDHSLEIASEGVAVRVTGTVVLDLEGAGLVSTELVMRIEHGADDVVLVLEGTAQAVTGSIRYNGDVVVRIGGTPEAPTFTDAGGGELTAAEVEALLDLLDLAEDAFDFAEHVFHPFTEVAG